MADPAWIFEKASRGKPCPYCDSHQGAIARVFPSEDSFRAAGGTDDDESIDDPVAAYGVWPGKNNVGRKPKDWLLTAPAHPNCGDSWHEIAYGDVPFNDWYAGIDREKLIKKHTTVRIKKRHETSR